MGALDLGQLTADLDGGSVRVHVNVERRQLLRLAAQLAKDADRGASRRLRHLRASERHERRGGASERRPASSLRRLVGVRLRLHKKSRAALRLYARVVSRPLRSALPEGMAAIMGRVATELVAGVVVGTFIGWLLDRWLETSPLFLLVMFFLSAIAGMLNVWRVFSGHGLAAGYLDEHKGASNLVRKGDDRT